MKADGIGTRNVEAVIAPAQGHGTAKIKTNAVAAHALKAPLPDHVSPSLERADRIAATVGKKLDDMASLASQMESTQDDIIREQLSRFFNVLRAFIREALHPTGDWTTDRLVAGKGVAITSGGDGQELTVQGENLAATATSIPALTKASTKETIQAVMASIKKARGSVRKLRAGLATAKAHVSRQTGGSSGVTL